MATDNKQPKSMETIICELNKLKIKMVELRARQERQSPLMKKHRENLDWLDEDDPNRSGKTLSIDEYAAILRRTYHRAPKGDKMLALNLFGIRYGQAIRKAGLSVAEIVRRSEIGQFEQEVNGGVKLSPYVEMKDPSKWLA